MGIRSGSTRKHRLTMQFDDEEYGDFNDAVNLLGAKSKAAAIRSMIRLVRRLLQHLKQDGKILLESEDGTVTRLEILV